MKIFSERSEPEDFDEEAYQKSKRGERRQAYIFLILGVQEELHYIPE